MWVEEGQVVADSPGTVVLANGVKDGHARGYR